MKAFIFNDKNGSGSLIVSANNYNEAEEYMTHLGLNINNWRCEDIEGENEE